MLAPQAWGPESSPQNPPELFSDYVKNLKQQKQSKASGERDLESEKHFIPRREIKEKPRRTQKDSGGKAKAEGEGDSDAASKGELDESQAFLFLGQSSSPHDSQLHLWSCLWQMGQQKSEFQFCHTV